MAHACHAIECDVEVPPSMLMCRKHWFQVPYALRRAVWFQYERGITKKYCEVAKSAVRAVAEKEERTVTGMEKEILLYDLIQTED